MILAIDTSVRRRCVAVVCSAGADIEYALSVDGNAVTPTLIAAMRNLCSYELDAVVVAIGPGSYTGVRAGMAAALGVVHARDIPLHGAGSLEVVAHGAAGHAGPVRAISDAGRAGLFVADFIASGQGITSRGVPFRCDAAELRGLGAHLIATDPALADHGATVADPAQALARAAAAATATPPLQLPGLGAVYVTAASWQAVTSA